MMVWSYNIRKIIFRRWSASTQMIITISWQKDDIMVIISNRALQWWTNIIMSIWPMSDVFAIFTPPWYVFHKCEYLYRFYLYLHPWSVFEKCELEKQVGHFCYFFSPRVKLITTNFEKHLDSEITGTYSSANLTSQY